MRDPRLDKLAHVLVHYSVAAKPGQYVLVTGPACAEPLVVATYEETLRAGANPVVRLVPDEATELLYRLGNDEQLSFVSDVQRLEVERMDARIGIWGDVNTRSLSSIDPARQAIRAKATRPLMSRLDERFAAGQYKWVGTEYPTQATAQDAEMSLREWEDFIFAAGLLHLDDPAAAWRRIHEAQQRVCDFLAGCREFRIVGPDTDLAAAVEGRRWINCAGTENFPDGEVFSAPIEDSVNGHVRFSFPAIYAAREVADVRLTFKDGKVTDAAAAKGEPFLHAMLDTDAGARRLGELAIGTNFAIRRFTRNILFDEKIGGTCHMALGEGYRECGAANTSSIHWDMICDLRDGGRILADGKPILENGRFLNPAWPKPEE